MAALEATLFLALFLLPGAAIVRICGGTALHYAIAVPVTCGALYTLGIYSSSIGIMVDSTWFVLVASGLVLVAVFLMMKTRPRFSRPATSDLVGLVCAVSVGLVLILTWLWETRSTGQLLPNHDAMYHSYVIKNIIETKSIAVQDALRIFPIGAGSAADFYPLGMHAPTALLSDLVSVSVNGSMNIVTFVLGMAFFPVAMWIWCRELIGRGKRIALFAPVATLMLSSVFPWSPLSWGGMPTIVAMAMAPAVAVLLHRALKACTTQSVVLMSICLVGVFSIHSTELVTVFALVALLKWKENSGLTKRQLAFLSKVGTLSAVALIPVVLPTLGGATERSLDYQPVQDVVSTLGHTLLFSFTGYLLWSALLLVCVGILVVTRDGNVGIPVAFFGLITIVVLAAGVPQNQLLSILTKPWYGQVLRLHYNIVYLAVPLVAVALAFLTSHRSLRSLKIGGIALAVVLTGTGIQQVSKANHALLASWYSSLIPTNQDSIAAFDWMASTMDTTNEYVMTDFDGVDGSTWMYALSGVRPVMYGALSDSERDRFRAQKTAVLDAVGDLGKHPDLLLFLKESRIRFFYFDERTNAVSPTHSISLDDLRSDARLREVFSRNNAHVFEFIFSEVA